MLTKPILPSSRPSQYILSIKVYFEILKIIMLIKCHIIGAIVVLTRNQCIKSKLIMIWCGNISDRAAATATAAEEAAGAGTAEDCRRQRSSRRIQRRRALQHPCDDDNVVHLGWDSGQISKSTTCVSLDLQLASTQTDTASEIVRTRIKFIKVLTMAPVIFLVHEGERNMLVMSTHAN